MPKAKKPSEKPPAISVQTGNGGVGIGGNATNTTIITGTAVIQPPAPPPESHDTIGFIPSFKGETYVHRGKIEEDVRAFLKNGGTGAIVGLHAPGGLGKTELAKHAAEDLKGEFKDGILWIDVGEKKPYQVIADMLAKCGVQTQPGATYEQQLNELRHALMERRFLVVLDDVRTDALAGLADYLPPKPCSALITSRIQQIGGVNRTFALDHLTEEQAKELMDAVLGEEVVNVEKETAEKLAARCAFNPLALEIAARRIRQLQGIKKPIARYFEMAQARFRELKMEGDTRWNMETVFDLSYNDLSPEDQKRFRTLAVFAPTGFSPRAAAHLWGLDESGAGEILRRFQNLSLVLPVKGDFIRYRLHDLLDEYAGEKLRKDGKEAREFGDKLADWLIGFYNELYVPDIDNLPMGLMEKDNLLKACAHTRGYKDGDRLAQLTTRTLNWFNVYFVESKSHWLAWLEASLQLGIDVSTNEGKQLKANVLQAIGDVQQFRDDRDAALDSYNAALTLFRQVGDKLGEANVYLSLGGLKRGEKDFAGARNDFENALQVYRMIGDQYSQARALYRLGDCFSGEEKYGEAIAQYENAIQLWTAIGITDLVESILKPRLEEAKKHLK
jgi:tetratricopeptide (TPR) repeat protein